MNTIIALMLWSVAGSMQGLFCYGVCRYIELKIETFPLFGMGMICGGLLLFSGLRDRYSPFVQEVRSVTLILTVLFLIACLFSQVHIASGGASKTKLRAAMLLLTGVGLSFLVDIYGPIIWLAPAPTLIFMVYPLLSITFPLFAPFGVWMVQKSGVRLGLDHPRDQEII